MKGVFALRLCRDTFSLQTAVLAFPLACLALTPSFMTVLVHGRPPLISMSLQDELSNINCYGEEAGCDSFQHF